MSGDRAHLVLIPGAGLGAWIWQDAIDGVGPLVCVEYPEAVRDDGSVADYAAEAIRQVDAAGADHVILVGHSVGTVVAHAVAAALGERVDGYLSIAGVVPRVGRSFLHGAGFRRRAIAGVAMRLRGTRPPDAMIRKGLASGLSSSEADRIIGRFVPESQRLFRDGLSPLPQDMLRGYLFATEDRTISAASQHLFAQRLRASFTVELPTGHLPMIEAPDLVRAALTEFRDLVITDVQRTA